MTVRSHIRGLSEKRSLPVLGKLRLGAKAVNQRPCRDHERAGKPDPNCQRCTHPVMLDYFATDDTVAGRAFREQFGEKPQTLPIEFPVDDEAIVAAHNLELWGDGLKRCTGDGYVANALVMPGIYRNWQQERQHSPDAMPPEGMWARSGFAPQGQAQPERVEIPCLGGGYDGQPACPMFGSRGCQPSMHLKFIVRGYPALGVWQLDTGSVMSIERVLSYLALLREWHGSISRIPLRLSLAMTNVRGRDFYPLRLDLDLPADQLTAFMASPVLQIAEPEADDAPIDTDGEHAEHGPGAVVVPEIIETTATVAVSEPVEERPFEVDDVAHAERLVAWAEESLGVTEAMVFSVLGVRDIAGIVLMGVPEAQAKLEAAHADSAPQERRDATSDVLPGMTRIADLLRWSFDSFGYQPKHVLAALKCDVYGEIEAMAAASDWHTVAGKVRDAAAVKA